MLKSDGENKEEGEWIIPSKIGGLVLLLVVRKGMKE